MTTYTIPAYALVFDNKGNGNGNTALSLNSTDFTIVAPDAATAFTYSYDAPSDSTSASVTLTANEYSLTANGGAVDLEMATDTEIEFLNWGAGNTTQILVFFIPVSGVLTDFVVALGGDPLPAFASAAEFNTFLQGSATGAGKITSGPFAPGVAIPFNSPVGTTTTENDVIVGTGLDDTFFGGLGADSIDGGAGNDSLDGGAGNDTLTGGLGYDTIYGGAGDDSIYGGAADDIIYGGAGDDSIYGGAGDDLLDGGAGDDVINPGDADGVFGDIISGYMGNDSIIYSDNVAGYQELDYSGLTAGITFSLDAGTNTASTDKGVNGTDTITDINNPLIAGWTAGGFGVGGTGFADVFNLTLSGDQWMQVRGMGGADTFNITLNGGIVRVDYSWSSSGINVNLATGVVSDDGNGFSDTINATGTGGNLEIMGTRFADTIVGSNADERFILGAGSDSLDGGAGVDLLRYDFDGVTVDMAAGTATGTWVGMAFTDTFTGIESIRGSNTGGDTITGDAFADTLDGRGGNDTLFGGAGNDSIYGGDGNDTISGGAGSDSLSGGLGDDLFTSGAGADAIDGGLGVDTVDYSASTNAQTINLVTNVNIGGEAHHDTLTSIENVLGSATRGDKITGSAGSNVLHGNGAGDILRGFNGDDFIFGDANNDFLFGGRGADALDGGNGIDWAMYNDSSAGVTVDLTGIGAGGFAQGDTYTGIENIRGSIHDDTLTGDAGINKIIGDKGNDIINGMGGRDNLRGGIGNDTLNGGAGIDGLRGDAGDDVFVFMAGNGLDNVLDFDDFGNDQIDLSSFGFSTYADVQAIMHQVGGHVRIDLGGSDILLLRGTVLADMTASDFIL